MQDPPPSRRAGNLAAPPFVAWPGGTEADGREVDGPDAGVQDAGPGGHASALPVPDGSRRSRRRRRRILRRTLIGLGATILAGIVAFAGLLAVTPSVGNAEALARAQDRAHGAVFPGPPVPPRFAAAIVATEDHRFGSEPGIDPFAVGRVAAARLTGGTDQGGATIYQQLAKMLYTRGRSGVAAELEQIALAVKLAMSYTPQQVLQMYADVAYFGNGDYGLAAASCGYFGVGPARLSWPQAALLAGLVQGPSADDPLRHPDRARQREGHVLGRLVAVGKLSQAQAATALAQPLTRLVANPGKRRCAA
jgi:membrane peptidoglycan carboxypeptidase